MLKLILPLILLLTLTACTAPTNSPSLEEPPQEQSAPAEPLETLETQEEPPPAPTVPGPPEPDAVWNGLPEFMFCSGAGGWRTTLRINPDGSFTGNFSDSDAMPPTYRFCNFSGQFSEPERIDGYTYSMKMESITLEDTPGEEFDSSDGVRRIASTPYGLEKADEVLLYFPGKKVSELPESFLAWSHGPMYWDMEAETLPFYGLYNVEEGYGFVSYDDYIS